MFELRTKTIDPNQLRSRLDNQRAGAIVTFEGTVRNHNDGRQVRLLEYEAYEPLAMKEGDRILTEARQRFAVEDCFCIHRVGALAIGEIAVWVGVSAAHREAAFLASRFIIDEIKQRVPIWKKEHYVDGASEWVNCAHHLVHT